MQIEVGIDTLTVKLGSLSLTLEPEVRESRPTMVLSHASLHPVSREPAGLQCVVAIDHLTISLELGS